MGDLEKFEKLREKYTTLKDNNATLKKVRCRFFLLSRALCRDKLTVAISLSNRRRRRSAEVC